MAGDAGHVRDRAPERFAFALPVGDVSIVEGGHEILFSTFSYRPCPHPINC